MTFTVYILECADGSYYTGLTRRPIEGRLWEHNAGIMEGYTRSRTLRGSRSTAEERTLRAELPGYADYMQRVRCRWIPGVW